MDAFFAVECRHAAFAGRDGLAAAQLDANFGAAFLAQFRIQEHDMVRVTPRRLHLATHEQCVLV